MAGSAQQDDDAITGINVTPFVDIALVLLIIFMVTAKYIVQPQAIPVDLPPASTGAGVSTAIAVSIDQTGALFVDARPVTETELQAQVSRRHAENRDIRAIIAADERVTHGRVVHVIDLVRRAGVTKFAIQTQPESVPGASTPATP